MVFPTMEVLTKATLCHHSIRRHFSEMEGLREGSGSSELQTTKPAEKSPLRASNRLLRISGSLIFRICHPSDLDMKQPAAFSA